MPSTISRLKTTDGLPQWVQKINGLISIFENFLGTSGAIGVNSGSTLASKQLCMFDTSWANYDAIGDVDVTAIVSSSTPTATFSLTNAAITNKSALASGVDPANDYLLIFDASASSLKKLTPSVLLSLFSVGGTNGSVQYNISSALAGDSTFLYDPTNKILSLGGGLVINTNALFVNYTNKRVGLGTITPAYILDVVGDINTSTFYRVGGVNVLSGTSLGNSVVNSNLTSLGIIAALSATNAGISNTLSTNLFNCSGAAVLNSSLSVAGQIKSGPQGNNTIISDVVDVSTNSAVSVGLGYLVLANSISLTLPTASGLIDGDRISFIPGGITIKNYTVSRNSSTIMGSASDLLVDMYASFDLVWDATNSNWVLG